MRSILVHAMADGGFEARLQAGLDLARRFDARKAGFMVMGAYGRPRMIETLFGGVTRVVLANPAIPVVMAH